MKIGVICGMLAEADALGRWKNHPDISVGISGAVSDQAENLARSAVQDGAQGLVSWGLAGGLAPSLQSGAFLQPAAVFLPDGGRVELGRGMMADVAIAGSDQVIATPGQKADLYAATGAVAVDMETHRLAQVSMDTGVDLKIARAVSDPADRALPALAATALGPDGRPRIGRVILGLARRPWQLPALLAAKTDSDLALRTLADAADDVVGPLLGKNSVT